jgi:TolB-like protein
MKTLRWLCLALGFLIASTQMSQGQDMEKELSSLSQQLADSVKEHGKKKVAVLDFTDLKDASNEFGRYLSEELTIDLVMMKRDFSVLDRANLKSILAEHKLTAQGLVNPENAKMLGQFAGVDALVIGKMIVIDQDIELSAKIITTDTAEIIGAARTKFKSNATAQKLLATAVPETDNSSSVQDEPKVIKSFGDLRVEMPPLRIVNGNSYELTLIFTNTGRNSLWVAASTDMGSNIRAMVTDESQRQYGTYWNAISGLAFSALQNGNIFKATEVPAHDSVTATIRFGSPRANPGKYRLQMELLLSTDFNGQYGQGSVRTLAAELKAK